MPHLTAHSFAPTAHGDEKPWLNDYFRHIAEEIRELQVLLVKSPQHAEPAKLYDGLIEFADGTDWNPGRGRGLYFWTEEPAPGEWNYLESFSVNRAGFGVNWRNVWTQDLYYKGDMVRDSEWTMIANKETTDRPAPQATGPATFALPATPTWDAIQSNTSVVTSGHTYIFTENGWITTMRIWVVSTAASYVYRVLIIDQTDPANPRTVTIDNPNTTADDWAVLAFTNDIIVAGTRLSILLLSLNSDSDTTVVGNWRNDGIDNAAAPATGGYNRNQQNTLLRISDSDLAPVDRSTDLASFIVDTTIRFVGTDVENFVLYRVTAPLTDNGTYFSYPVTVVAAGGDIPISQTSAMTATIPEPDPTQYRRLTNQWVAGEPTWATVSGVLEYDGAPQPGNVDNAFGVDIEFQPATSSPDWDLVAVSDT